MPSKLSKSGGIALFVLSAVLMILVFGNIVFTVLIVPATKINRIVLQTEMSLGKEELLGMMQVEEPLLYFKIDSERVETVLGNHPEVENAIVTKSFPETLEITLSARVPVAQVRYEDDIVMIDKKGMAYTPIVHNTQRNVPVVTSTNEGLLVEEIEKVASLLYDLKIGYPDSYQLISELVLLSDREMHIYLMEKFLPIRSFLAAKAENVHDVIFQTRQLYGVINPTEYIEIDARSRHAIARGTRL